MNRSILKDKAITISRPDITFTDKITDTTCVLDIAVPHTDTHTRARAVIEKCNKLRYLASDVKHPVKRTAVQVVPIMWATGIPATCLSTGLQKFDLCATTHVSCGQ
jgi:hypothetical protein